MSEPSLSVAWLPMSADAFKSYRKAEGAALAKSAAAIVTEGLQDWFVIRHLPRRGALFVAYIHRWEERADVIVPSSYFQALLRASRFIAPGATGRILIAFGAMNFLSDGIEQAYALNSEGVSRDESASDDEVHLSDDELQLFDARLNEHLFSSELYDRPYLEAIARPAVMDGGIRKLIEKELSRRRLQIARESLPKATPEKPVCLFSGYHFNGHFVVHYVTGRITPLLELDAASLVQKPWGAADKSHVAVASRVIATNPDKFRVVPIKGGDGNAFYRDAIAVYDSNCNPIAGADANSFEHVAAGYLRDKDRWFYFDGTVLADVGPDARIDASLYYYVSALLIGRRSVYLGKRKLPVDASTFELVRIERVHRRREPEVGLVWARDKDGDIVVACQVDADSTTIERCAEPEAVWNKLAARVVPMKLPPPFAALAEIEAVAPRWLEDAAINGVEPESVSELESVSRSLERWFDSHQDMFLRDHPFERRFWTLTLYRIYAFWRLGRFEELGARYEAIADRAWMRAEIFDYAARCYMRSGKPALAVGAIRRAIQAGFEKSDALLDDPEFAPLAGDKGFEALRAFVAEHGVARRPFLALDFLRAIAKQKEHGQSDLASELDRRFHVPSASHIEKAFKEQPAIATEYAGLLRSVAAHCVRWSLARGWQVRLEADFYRRVRDLPGLAGSAHLAGALALFAEGWFWVDLDPSGAKPREEFPEAMQALAAMKAALESPSADDDDLWRDISQRHDIEPFIKLTMIEAPK